MNKKTVFWMSLGILLIFGIIYSLHRGEGLVFPDEKEYCQLAINLIEKGNYSFDGINPTASRPPGMPVFLALLYAIGAKTPIVLILHYILLVWVLMILSKIFHELFEKWGCLEVLIIAMTPLFYPVIFYTTGTLYPQILVTFLFVLGLKMIQVSKPMLGGFVSGLCIGILILCSPNYYFLFLAIFVYTIYVCRKYFLRFFLMFVIGVITVFSPWWIRNFQAYHQFVPISTNGGWNLFMGNNPLATADSGVNIPIGKMDMSEEGNCLSELETDKFYQKKAVQWFFENPQHSIILYFKKVLNHFNYWNQFATTSETSPWKAMIMGVSYYSMLGLVVVRIFHAQKEPLLRIEIFCLALYILASFFLAIFMTRIRYRLPFDTLLLPIAVHGIYLLRRRFIKPSS